MTAPAINALNTATALPGATAPAAGSAATGFDALLAALFPPADPGADLPGAAAAAADLLAGGADKDGEAADGEITGASTVVVDANAALAAALVATTAAAVEPPPSSAAPNATDAARTTGAARAAILPLLRQTHAATPNTTAPDAEATGDDAATDEPARPETPRTAHGQAAPDAKQAPPAWGRDKPAGQAAAPALANASPKAELGQKADTASPDSVPAPEAAPAPAAVETAVPVVAAGLAARPEPAAPAKPAKSERGKTTTDAAAPGDVKASVAADQPATARAVTAAARPATAQADAQSADLDPDAATAETAADQPDFTPTVEARAANASSAPGQQVAHAVRGSPETVANLSAQIIKKLEGQSTRFDVELDPQGLGKVHVRIDIGAHGAITAAMSFDNPQAAAELRSRAAELQRALEQAGFNLSGGVSFDVAQDRGHQGQPWQDQTDNNSGRAFRGQAFQAALDTAGDAANAALGGALRLRRGVTAGLDMRI
ncbi:flagellar hook-length control protein FliK [uncultured Phenylobacterium sp.]|uniref:flagellar hook-length control protein FliK n=1 Tax=uncultured Phenylobacterium sp. TaxID=349273 RepID=UPI0025CD1D14|nr:flagellar hook-length control protein FliK [uncultured Phenylobacterium sp.]